MTHKKTMTIHQTTTMTVVREKGSVVNGCGGNSGVVMMLGSGVMACAFKYYLFTVY